MGSLAYIGELARPRVVHLHGVRILRVVSRAVSAHHNLAARGDDALRVCHYLHLLSLVETLLVYHRHAVVIAPSRVDAVYLSVSHSHLFGVLSHLHRAFILERGGVETAHVATVGSDVDVARACRQTAHLTQIFHRGERDARLLLAHSVELHHVVGVVHRHIQAALIGYDVLSGVAYLAPVLYLVDVGSCAAVHPIVCEVEASEVRVVLSVRPFVEHKTACPRQLNLRTFVLPRPSVVVVVTRCEHSSRRHDAQRGCLDFRFKHFLHFRIVFMLYMYCRYILKLMFFQSCRIACGHKPKVAVSSTERPGMG